ncbi:MAG: C25 family cysteine peptidase [Candidatus Poribacteria bacterium]
MSKSSVLILAILVFFFIFNTIPCYAENIKIVEQSNNSLILQFTLPELNFTKRSIDGKTFTNISFNGSLHINENGKPLVPFYSVMLGIPDSSDPTVSVLDTTTNLINGYKLMIYNDPDSETRIADFRTKSGFYPEDIVKISVSGYMRQQKVARLAIYPVHYNDFNNQIKVYKNIKISVNFGNSVKSKIMVKNDSDYIYEDVYKETLLNYEQAKAWRIPRKNDESAKLAPSMSPSTQGLSYKIVVDKNGIYKIDYNYLLKAGIDPNTIDPRKIELKTSGKQVPIYVEGYNDGKFDPEDYIEFYGTKNTSVYTNENVYWLSWATKENPNIKSLMMTVKDGKPQSGTTPPTAFKTTERFEVDNNYDPLKKVTSESVDHFFWRPFRGQDSRYNKTDPIEIALPYRAPNLYSNYLALRVCFQGITYAKGASKHIMKIFLNGSLLDTAIWEGPNEYISESFIRQSDVHRSNWLVLECEDNNDTRDDTDPKWDLYLNWYEVEYWREFVAKNNILEFSTETIPSVTRNAVFTITKMTRPEIEVFQIDKLGAIAKIINPDVKKAEDGTYTVSFEDNVIQPTKYHVTTTSAILQPKSIIKDEPSTLHNPANSIDYIMITHRDFMKSTQRLADFRRKQGLNVLVVDVDDIYDEFSYGIFDPRAIKRFLRYAYFNWAIMPTYVLLMGDAHWDYKYVYDEYYKKYPVYPRIYVPTYHAPSMPYGETALDNRFVTVSGDDIIPDMILGRIPIDSKEEADTVVDKTIEYETKSTPSPWQSKIMLIADDEKSKSGDEIFEDSRRDLAENYVPVGYETLPVYLRVIKEPYQARKQIFKYINDGVVLMEFSGHGGAYYWAHENIFDGDDVKKLQNSIYPFVITTTCENGYFDNPLGANKTLIDLFLIQPKAGAVACLSATRLTYGQGNAIFDKVLYPIIFDEKPPIIGKIVNKAIIEFIKLDIPAWTATAEQYTIFGDPAVKLALPERQIECEISKTSVSLSSKVELKSGHVKKLEIDKTTGKQNWAIDTGFNGQLIASVVYPNNLDTDDNNDIPVQIETSKISKGEFKNIPISILGTAKPGKANIRLYAYNENSSAIGGVKFSISTPVVDNIISKISDDESLQIYVAITDDLGLAGIKSVDCEWRNTETWADNKTKMEVGNAPDGAPNTEGNWFVLTKKIPLSRPGTKIDFRIRVWDTEGNEVLTEYESVKVPVEINLTIPKPTQSSPPEISYTYSTNNESWTLSIPIENTGNKEITKPVYVIFFEGNPDRNKDDAVDSDAKILGIATIKPDQWEKIYVSGSFSPIQRAIAETTLKKPLLPGIHMIFAWVNPFVLVPLDQPIDRIEDGDETDNIGSKLFQINEFLIGKGDSETYAQSLDGSLEIVIPPNSADEAVMSISRHALPVGEWKQEDLQPAPMPSTNGDNGAFKIQLSSGAKTLNKEAEVTIKFDVAELREIAKKAKGLGNKKEGQLTYTEKEWINIAMQEEAKKLGVYAWQDDLGMWRYLPSELVMENPNSSSKEFKKDYYVTVPITENRSDMSLNTSNIKVDEVATPIGNWAILFLDNYRYKVYFRREGNSYYETLMGYGETYKTFENQDLGVQIYITDSDKPFAFGDMFKFDTYREIDGAIKARGFLYFNEGDGTAHISIIGKEEGLINQQVGSWVIFFLDSKRFEVLSQYGSPVPDDEGFALEGTVGKEVFIANIGLRVEVHEGKYPFQFGDKFVFQTLFTGSVKAKIKELKTIALMHNNDNISPNVELWVNGLIPKSGAVIPPKPTISLMLSDSNGVDVSSLKFMVSVNDREFSEVPRSDYVLSDRSQLDNIPIFYSPTLNIGKYRYRISVKDFNGNISYSDNGDFYEFMFLVEEKPDLSPPTIIVTVDGKTIQDGEIFSKSPIFNINISDDNAIDIEKIEFSMSSENEELKPLDKKEYIITSSNDLKKADIVYPTQFMNGTYLIQVKAVDTSGNISFLTPSESNPLKFIVKEKVEVTEIMNAPNPFSDTTVFSYYLTQPADKVIIKIYTLRGKLIKTIEQDSPRWKYNEEFWNGRDEDDNKLSSGVYLYKFVVYSDGKKIEKIGKLAIIR